MDKFVEGSATAGTVKSAGLPNITGDFSIRNTNGTTNTVYSGNGCVYLDSRSSAGGLQATSNGAMDWVRIDASRSSSIYGNSSTVQPPALTMRPFIYTGKTSMNKWKRTA